MAYFNALTQERMYQIWVWDNDIGFLNGFLDLANGSENLLVVASTKMGGM